MTIVAERRPLRDWLRVRQLSVVDFAELVDVTPGAVYKWLGGGKISRRRLRSICLILGVAKEQIL